MTTTTLRRDALAEIDRLLLAGFHTESAHLRAMLTELERRFWIGEHHRWRMPQLAPAGICPTCWGWTVPWFIDEGTHARVCETCHLYDIEGRYATDPNPHTDYDAARDLLSPFLRVDYLVELPGAFTIREIRERGRA